MSKHLVLGRRASVAGRLGVFGVFAALLAGAAGPALGADGVIEINQARALAGSITPSDVPGFPVTLGAPGSYRLTSNLDLRGIANAQNLDAIAVTADGVSIDLNGFAILGPTVCAGFPPLSALICGPTGGGRGIDAVDRTRVTIANGIVDGSGEDGVSCGKSCRVERMHVANAGRAGIVVGDGSVVLANTARRNGGEGIAFRGVGGSTIEGNSASENGATGIFSGSGDTVHANTCRSNRSHGILANPGATVRGNSVSYNGGAGLFASSNNLVVDNTSSSNLGFGLQVSASGNVAYGRNVLQGNIAGTVSGGTQIQIGANVCNLSLTCP